MLSQSRWNEIAIRRRRPLVNGLTAEEEANTAMSDLIRQYPISGERLRKKGTFGPFFAYYLARRDPMKNLFRLVAVSLVFASVTFCQTSNETTNLRPQGFETNLAGGVNLRLNLHDGDFRVVGSDSDKLSVHVEGKNVEQAKEY
jgi:hypothetical protein